MPGFVLTTTSSIMCPHGGQAVLVTSNTKLMLGGAPALLETDTFPVAGCSFTLPGPKPSPCVQIRWSAGAAEMSVAGAKVLITSSIGQCSSGEGAMQGIAIVNPSQTLVTAK
ncbi:MAG TPA: hypothetical protein VF525_13005 [Pyrinomonadaceae bacterium]|jgi:hypothetical protein